MRPTAAVAEAVNQGKLWLTSGQASILAEDIPAGLLTDDANCKRRRARYRRPI